MTDTTTRGALHPLQLTQLRAGVNPRRVLKDGKGQSHLSQQDVVAHLIRVFGYGNFDLEVLNVELIFEQRSEGNSKNGKPKTGWDVCYKALVRLSLYDVDGKRIAHYEDVSTGTAQNQTRGDGHDLAMKSAVSLAKKRSTINLGDQFGLSLYNKGQIPPLVVPPGKETIAETVLRQRGIPQDEDSETAPAGDIQDGVPQQVDLGDTDPESAPSEPVRTPEEVQQHLNRAGGQK